MTYQLFVGNNLEILPTLPDNSVDSIVTDPPYELGFMGKTWDNSGIAYSLELWQQCLRVLKPGGHLLAFSGSRTYHRMVVSIEDAGFEIRDMISWISNKTFPKSLNIGKAIDKLAGIDRNKWEGWGTGLKPTVEPIVMARKPVEGTVANNVLTYGTGGLNIDGSRIGADMSEFFSKTGNPRSGKGHLRSYGATGDFGGDGANPPSLQGRWPANVILDEQAAELLDEQSGTTTSKSASMKAGLVEGIGSMNLSPKAETYQSIRGHDDTGGASRFFYVAKASKRDRNEGLEDLEESVVGSYAGNVANKGNKIGAEPNKPNQPAKNFHPTVKPTELMRYLVKLITPPSGTVLDPFTGSGSTGKAAILEGFDFIGIELTEDYWPIIEGRLKHAEAKVAERIKETSDQEQEKLF
jgi:site-specific DNA-methyltransferase (adenine-specific)